MTVLIALVFMGSTVAVSLAIQDYFLGELTDPVSDRSPAPNT